MSKRTRCAREEKGSCRSGIPAIHGGQWRGGAPKDGFMVSLRSSLISVAQLGTVIYIQR